MSEEELEYVNQNMSGLKAMCVANNGRHRVNKTFAHLVLDWQENRTFTVPGLALSFNRRVHG